MVLDKETSTWNVKNDWIGLVILYGSNLWTDGKNIYYSNGNNDQYILDKITSTWEIKEWNDNINPYTNYMMTDKYNNVYYLKSLYPDAGLYILDKETSTWILVKTIPNFNLYGDALWSDGENIYSSYQNQQYMFLDGKIKTTAAR